MPGIFPKRYPGMLVKPTWPFFAAGCVILYGVNSFAEVMKNTDEYKNDPRNPNYKGPAVEAKH